MSQAFMNSSKDEIPKGYSLLKMFYWYVKALVSVGLLGHQKDAVDSLV